MGLGLAILLALGLPAGSQGVDATRSDRAGARLVNEASKPAVEGTTLVTRASPKVSMAGLGGCASVLLVAEIRGPEVEGWYCPRVEWEFPDGTRATEESDCPPFDQREEFPRFWSRRVCSPATPPGTDAWEVGVTMTRAGRMVAHGVTSFAVH